MPHRVAKPRTKNIWLPFLLAFVLIAGLVIGFYLNKYLGSKRDFANIFERNDRLEEIIDIIHEKYVDSISSDSLYNDAISGILSHLDPHTSYIAAKDFESVNSALEGNFKGLGMEYQLVNDTPMVSMITPNSPAFFAGVETGDLLLKINDTSVANVQITKKDLVRMARNSATDQVKLDIYRPIESRTLSINIEKGEVHLKSIDAAYMLEEQTGYIRIKRFSADTYEEYLNESNRLLEQGMKKLIVDLRQNPGGYLEAATEIADEFISGNKLLVYTYGTKIGREDYNAYRTGNFETGRLVVLLDEASASASEILAGAVQDWDRGIIIGRNSYGKGLVQEQFELGDGAALRITIARYYTPVGRSIQRAYEDRTKYLAQHDPALLAAMNDSVQLKKMPKFYTEGNNRLVYGGGGIQPDINFSNKNDSYSAALSAIINDAALEQFIYQYYKSNSKQFKGLASFKDFDQTIGFGGELGKSLDRVASSITPAYAQVKNNPKELTLLRNYVKATLARIQFNNEGYYQIMNRSDLMLKKALMVINSDEYSKLINGERRQPTD